MPLVVARALQLCGLAVLHRPVIAIGLPARARILTVKGVTRPDVVVAHHHVARIADQPTPEVRALPEAPTTAIDTHLTRLVNTQRPIDRHHLTVGDRDRAHRRPAVGTRDRL